MISDQIPRGFSKFNTCSDYFYILIVDKRIPGKNVTQDFVK